MSENQFSPQIGAQQQGDKIIVTIDLEKFLHDDQRHPEDDPGVIIHYKIRVDDEYFELDSRHKKGAAILQLANKTYEKFDLFQIKKQGRDAAQIEIEPEELIDFAEWGIERFITAPKKELFCFSIGKKKYHTKFSSLTVKQILVDFANVDPQDKTLALKTPNGFQEYDNIDEVIKLDNCPHFDLFDNTPTTVS